MDYMTQTGSEFFELLTSDSSSIEKTHWQDEDSNGISDGKTWATSREYLLGEGICTEALCLEFDTTASIELMWIFNTEAEATNFLGTIDKMELHLSDEARGLPAVVPVPAAVWLFGSGMIGLVGLARRRKA